VSEERQQSAEADGEHICCTLAIYFVTVILMSFDYCQYPSLYLSLSASLPVKFLLYFCHSESDTNVMCLFIR